MYNTGPGFRVLSCDECGYESLEHSRDRKSPSGDECPCGNWMIAREATEEDYERLS